MKFLKTHKIQNHVLNSLISLPDFKMARYTFSSPFLATKFEFKRRSHFTLGIATLRKKGERILQFPLPIHHSTKMYIFFHLKHI